MASNSWKIGGWFLLDREEGLLQPVYTSLWMLIMQVSSHNQQHSFTVLGRLSSAHLFDKQLFSPWNYATDLSAGLFLSMLYWKHSIHTWMRFVKQNSLYSISVLNFFCSNFDGRCVSVGHWWEDWRATKWQVILFLLIDKFMCDKLEVLAGKSCWYWILRRTKTVGVIIYCW